MATLHAPRLHPALAKRATTAKKIHQATMRADPLLAATSQALALWECMPGVPGAAADAPPRAALPAPPPQSLRAHYPTTPPAADATRRRPSAFPIPRFARNAPVHVHRQSDP